MTFTSQKECTALRGDCPKADDHSRTTKRIKFSSCDQLTQDFRYFDEEPVFGRSPRTHCLNISPRRLARVPPLCRKINGAFVSRCIGKNLYDATAPFRKVLNSTLVSVVEGDNLTLRYSYWRGVSAPLVGPESPLHTSCALPSSVAERHLPNTHSRHP